jgi:DNA invertase Pin-like site-specific DNA recombinase|tara:strand:- start:152 stop:826 length:675 start_codon:yes stop_codon:yes gene_type:complete
MDYVTYHRVSTTKQGVSGLGLESQQQVVSSYLGANGGNLVAEFTEVMSGKKDNRPELEKALRKCRLTGATLLIAKLDRLSRNRSFLMSLQDSKIKFVCVDMPEANHFTIGMMACMADYESQMISERTIAALKVAKARGVKLGNPRLDKVRNTDTANATAAKTKQARERNSDVRETIDEMIGAMPSDQRDCVSLRTLASLLNDAGYTTARGKAWGATSVSRVLAA